ncbi:MAG: hypothetical protein AAB919_00270 [Patescibacteria group bacterium]
MNAETKPTLQDFIERAKREDWPWVDANLTNELITPDWIYWVRRKGWMDDNDNVRDLAATIMMVSDTEINQIDQAWFEAWMSEDDFEVVRYRLAVALYKRGNRYDEVTAMFDEACKHAEIGPIALKYKEAA